MEGKVIVFILLQIYLQVNGQRCPGGWLEMEEGQGQKCYRFWPTRPLTWDAAQDNCKLYSGQLLQLSSVQERKWIISEINNYPASYEWWIGLRRDVTDDDTWVWLDKSHRNESNRLISWGSGEPNNFRDSEDCAEIWDDLLNDKNCNTPLQSICERPKDLPLKCDVDNGWFELLKPGETDDLCYKAMPAYVPYYQASTLCSGEQAEVLKIHTETQQKEFTDAFTSHHIPAVWVDANSSDVAKNFNSGQQMLRVKRESEPHTRSPLSYSTTSSSTRMRTATTPTRMPATSKRVPSTAKQMSTQTTRVSTTSKRVHVTTKRMSTKTTRVPTTSKTTPTTTSTTPPTTTTAYIPMCMSIDMMIAGYSNWRLIPCMDTAQVVCVKRPGMCPAGYLQHLAKCYRFETQTQMSWLDARSYCNLRATTLLKITSLEEHNVVQRMMRNQYELLPDITSAWLDFSNAGGDSWRWFDEDQGMTADFGTFENEQMKHFSLNKQMCGISPTGDGGWSVSECGSTLAVVCTIPTNKRPKTVGSDQRLPKYNCPTGFELHDKFCFYYRAITGPMDWFSARELCSTQQATMAFAYTETQQRYLSLNIEGDTWLGLNDRHAAKEYVWADNTPMVTAGFWLNSSADSTVIGDKYSTNCVVMSYNPDSATHGQWIKYPCAYKRDVICQKRAEYNIAIGKEVKQSSDYADYGDVYDAYKAIDGCKAATHTSSCCTHTDHTYRPYWELDLGVAYNIGHVKIYRRYEQSCLSCRTRMAGFRIHISNVSHTGGDFDDQYVVYRDTNIEPPRVIDVDFSEAKYGRYLSIALPGTQFLTLCEVEVTPYYKVDRQTSTIVPIPGCAYGACVFTSKERLTWADAYNVCTNRALTMWLPTSKDTVTFPADDPQASLWTGIYNDVVTKQWMYNGQLVADISNYAASNLQDIAATGQPVCIRLKNQAGQIEWIADHCAVRSRFTCIQGGSYEYITLGTGDYISVIGRRLTAAYMRFAFKGHAGASLKLLDSTTNIAYEIRIGLAKSYIRDIQTNEMLVSQFIENILYSGNYSDFWCSWDSGIIRVGKGKVSGSNLFMETGVTDIRDVDSVSIATFTGFKGAWIIYTDWTEETDTGEGINVALNKPAQQSSLLNSAHPASKAVDGQIAQFDLYENHGLGLDHCAITSEGPDPWWEVDLGRVFPIKEIRVYYQNYVSQMRVVASTVRHSTQTSDIIKPSNHNSNTRKQTYTVKGIYARYVRVDLPDYHGVLDLCEVEVIKDSDAPRCGQGWLDYAASNKCYKRLPLSMSHEQGTHICQQYSAQIILPQTPEEQYFIFEMLTPASYKADENFAWIKNTPDTSYLKFANTSVAADDCTALSLTSGFLYSIACHVKTTVICEKQEILTTSSTTVTSTMATTTLPFLTPATPTTGHGCDDNWYFNSFTNACYRLFEDKVESFREAIQRCDDANSRLTDVVDAYDQWFLNELIENSGVQISVEGEGVWVAGTDNDAQGIWQWYHSNQPLSPHLLWADGQPDNKNNGEHCLAMVVSEQAAMNDVSCDNADKQTGYICKHEIQPGQCEEGWEFHEGSYACYQLSTLPLGWDGARQLCKSQNSELASVLDTAEQMFLTTFIQPAGTHVWVGAHDMDIEGLWSWTDMEPWWDGIMWYEGQPDNWYTGEHCGMLRIDTGYLNDAQCGHRYPFICKRKAHRPGAITTTSAPVKTPTTPTNASTTTMATTTSSDSYNGDCGGDDWVYDQNSNQCFELNDRIDSWARASLFCSIKGASLLTILNDDDVNTVIAMLVKQGRTETGLWLGLTLTGTRNVWQWLNGSPMAYYKWAEAALSDDDANRCAVLITEPSNQHFGKWKTEDCLNSYHYVCTKQGVAEDTATSNVTTLAPTTTIPSGAFYGCPAHGWMEFQDACYLFVQESNTWTDAHRYCASEGADLARIDDEAEKNFIWSQLPQDSYCFNTWTNNTECEKWAELGECQRNPIWMATRCHKACAVCLHNCRDTYNPSSQCLYWAQHGECETNHEWMLTNCAQSCGICTGAPTRGYWIGMHRDPQRTYYRWSDGHEVAFTYWDTHEPRALHDEHGSCVAMYIQTGTWSDGDCFGPLSGFACRQAKSILDTPVTSADKIGCSGDNSYGYGAYCYTYVEEPKPWIDADRYCQTMTGTLAIIPNRYVQAFVASEIAPKESDQDWWIGLSMDTAGMRWTNLKPLRRFSNFEEAISVDGRTESTGCFAIKSTKPIGLWTFKSQCSTPLPFICQSPRVGFTTPLPTTPTTNPDAACPDKWSAFGDRCYKLFTELRSWVTAKGICDHYGASLVTVRSQEEQTYFASLHDPPIWIGLSDTQKNGIFSWVDSDVMAFTNWQAHEPNNFGGQEHCVQMNPGNQWNDAPCHSHNAFICQIQKGKPIPDEPHSYDELKVCDSHKADSGWYQYGDACYMLSKQAAKWSTADGDCYFRGGHLTSVHDIDENIYIATMLAKASVDNVWTGLQQDPSRQVLGWSDNSVLVFTNWRKTFPRIDAASTSCYGLDKYGLWKNYDCATSLFRYVCKKARPNLPATPVSPTSTTVVPDGHCDNDFLPFGDKCYYVGAASVSRKEAEQKCQSLNSRMLSIHSYAENAFVASLFTKEEGEGPFPVAWTGLVSRMTPQHVAGYGWQDGTTLDFTAWAPGEQLYFPDDVFLRKACVGMEFSRGFWKAVSCGDTGRAVCYKTKSKGRPSGASCRPGYSYHESHCYKLLDTKYSFNDVSNACTNAGAGWLAVDITSDTTDHAKLFYTALVEASNKPDHPVWINLKVQSQTDDKCCYMDKMQIECQPTSDCDTQLRYRPICSYSLDQVSSPPPTTTPDNTDRCPNRWLSYDKYCYDFLYDPAIATDAVILCRRRGMRLADIRSEEENHVLVQALTRQYLKIGHPRFKADKFLVRIANPDVIGFDDDKYGMTWSGLGYSNWALGMEHRPGCTFIALTDSKWRRSVSLCFKKMAVLCKAVAGSNVSTANSTLVSTWRPGISNSSERGESSPRPFTPNSFKPHGGASAVKSAESSSLTGGQIAGIVIGVIGFVICAAAVMYIVKTTFCGNTNYKIKEKADRDSVGFDNALFNRSQDTVALTGT